MTGDLIFNTFVIGRHNVEIVGTYVLILPASPDQLQGLGFHLLLRQSLKLYMCIASLFGHYITSFIIIFPIGMFYFRTIFPIRHLPLHFLTLIEF